MLQAAVAAIHGRFGARTDGWANPRFSARRCSSLLDSRAFHVLKTIAHPGVPLSGPSSIKFFAYLHHFSHSIFCSEAINKRLVFPTPLNVDLARRKAHKFLIKKFWLCLVIYGRGQCYKSLESVLGTSTVENGLFVCGEAKVFFGQFMKGGYLLIDILQTSALQQSRAMAFDVPDQ